MNIKNLSKFLVKAKINTYATSGKGGEKVISDGSKELEFKEGDFKYRDRYFGFDPFIGEEIVWQNEEIIWGMNYYGETISGVISPREIYQFLKKALREIKENKPFRGPDQFKEVDFEYINKVEGNIDKFEGRERILYKKKEVYKLKYHGGLIKKVN